MKLKSVQVFAANMVFKRLNVLRRWTSFVTEDKYNELSKQALNCIITYLLAAYSEKEGIVVNWEMFPKIALYRAYQKVYVYFDTPEYILNDIREIGGIPKEAFDEATKMLITKNSDADFANFICEGLGTAEMRIYKAATKIATMVELVENGSKMNPQDYIQNYNTIREYLTQFNDIPGINEFINIDGSLFKLLLKIATLRNKNRWAVLAYRMDCSVLGHLFDTAVFAYFMSLEQKPDDEVLATKMFFMGIFHDVAETWTTDIPSPIKDLIPNFRKATEEYERKKLEEEFYSKVPEFLEKKLREVMLEDESNIAYKKLLKGADYLSADSECWRQYMAGSRDEYFLGAMRRRLAKIQANEVVLTPVCGELFHYYLNYAEKLGLE